MTCAFLLRQVLARPIGHRFGSWTATIHLHLLGEGRSTLRVREGRATLEDGTTGDPTCVWVAKAAAFRGMYTGDRFAMRLLGTFQRREAFATLFEDVIMFAKCFDHESIRPDDGAAAEGEPPSLPPAHDVLAAGADVFSALLARRTDFLRDVVDRGRDLGSYHLDLVPLGTRDLAGFGWLVSTPGGLYAVSEREAVLVMRGTFFGVVHRPGAVHVFQANDDFLKGTRRGRIIRLSLDGTRISDATVVARGLDNACHQIDMVGDRMLVCDTSNDRVLELDSSFRMVAEHVPAGRSPHRTTNAHINSVLPAGDRRYVLCHNSTEWTRRPSEILECDASFNVLGRVVLRGGACHSLALCGDRVAVCLSELGEVECEGEVLARIDPGLFARGLSIDAERIVVGGSELPHRAHPRLSRGKIHFFRRTGALRSVVPVPGSVREIRALPWA